MRFTTYSGHQIDMSNIRVFDIRSADIVHALTQVCRFSGHCKEFYSVAQHSILVANLCKPEHKLAGLLHDAPEAYLGDVPTPIKQLLPEYRKIEAELWRNIATAYDLPLTLHESVHYCDRLALAVEADALCHDGSVSGTHLSNFPKETVELAKFWLTAVRLDRDVKGTFGSFIAKLIRQKTAVVAL